MSGERFAANRSLHAQNGQKLKRQRQNPCTVGATYMSPLPRQRLSRRGAETQRTAFWVQRQRQNPCTVGATYPTSPRLRRTSMSPLPRRCFIDEQTTMKPVDRRSARLEIAGLQHNRNAPGFYPLQHKSRRLESHQRRSGRVVDCGGFENRCGLRLTGGSNPSSSATISLSTIVAPSASAASRRAT